MAAAADLAARAQGADLAGRLSAQLAAVRGLKSTRPPLPRDELMARIETITRLIVSGAGALGYFR